MVTPIIFWLASCQIQKEKNVLQGGPKNSLWSDLEEKCLRNSKMCFDGVFLSTYIFTSSQEARAF